MGQPATLLVVVFDNIPKAVGEIKLNGGKYPVIIRKVPLFVPFWCVYRCFKVFLGDVTFSSSVKRYPSLEDFFCSGRRREVRFNVTIQRIVARLDLSQSWVEFSAYPEVSFFCRFELLRQVGPMAV